MRKNSRPTELSRRQAVLYARVSSKQQEKEGFSIPAQEKLLREYAQTERLEVVGEFTDVETAKQAGRTNFGEMVAFLKKHRSCRIVLVEKTDRLYRNITDWVILDDLDLAIHFVKEGTIISRDSRSSEKFVHGIKVLMAKNYVDNLSEESRKGMQEKAEEGIWPQLAPLGYRNTEGPNGKKVIEPDPEIAPIITRVFEWYATGEYSLRDLTRLAREAGLLRRRKNSLVPKSTIHTILRNRLYTGEFDWHGKTYPGIHAPLVSRELWEEVQARLDGRSPSQGRKVLHDFAYSRLITCGHCGCALVGEIKKGRYVYYHCTGFRGKCPEPYTREEVLEQQFSDLLKGLVIDPQVLEWIVQALRESHRDERQFHDEAIGRLQGEFVRPQNRIDAMYVDKLDGRIDGEMFDRKYAEWKAEQDRISRSVESHRNANRSYVAEGIQLLELAQRAHRLFQQQDASEKRRLLGFLLSNCTWKGGQIQPTLRPPFDLLCGLTQEAEKTAASGNAGDRYALLLPRLDSNQ